jgi:hypothetical protein
MRKKTTTITATKTPTTPNRAGLLIAPPTFVISHNDCSYAKSARTYIVLAAAGSSFEFWHL